MGIKLGIAVVTRKTRMQGLRERYATASMAAFALGQAQVHERARRAAHDSRGNPAKAATRQVSRAVPETDYDETAEATIRAYQQEDDAYRGSLEALERELDFGLPIKFVDRDFVPNFEFQTCELVVVVGQDGLVANVAKYVRHLPIVAVNPDPLRIDGVLLPFKTNQARRAVGRVLEGKAKVRPVTLAEVELNDGQRLLAFNDFFLGAASHVSARYVLRVQDREEPQSSSGVLVSTGAGSTGWFSSVFNMVQGVAAWQGESVSVGQQLPWEDRRLLWAVREPFASKHSHTNLVAGLLDAGQELILESLMPAGGVVFSDGIEADALQFNSGAIARVRAAEQRANIVVG
ncbi:MAG: hypothetical protein AB7O62_02820 [Pirellulales bacterium]